MLRVLFIFSGSHTPSDKNLNHFQRIYFLSRETKLTIFARREADFSVSAQPRTRIVHSPWKGKTGQLMYAFLWLLIAGRTREFDIVLTEPSILGLAGFFCKLVSGCKWVVDVWDIPIRNNLKVNYITNVRCKITRAIMKCFYKWADLFIVSILPDIELKYFHLNPGKMLCLKNAIWFDPHLNEDHFPRNGETFNIFCSRSIHTSDMGLDTLAQAYNLLNGKIENVSFTIVGQILKHVEAQVKQLKGLENVQFIDFVELNKLSDLVKSASVCVIPFRDVPDLAQTYPVKVIEYMARGKPIVASDIAGMRQLLEDGKNGLLFKAGNPGDLAEKLHWLYRDVTLRETLSRNAEKSAEQYDCKTKNHVIIEKLNQLVQTGRI
jgi:glycosyltransferase involved in cell wall biosynthesis